MPGQLPPHLQMHRVWRGESKRTLVGLFLGAIALFVTAGLFLRDLPKAFDGQVAATEVHHGRNPMCLIRVTTTSGTVRVNPHAAEPCDVLRPGLHVTKAAWSLWIGGGSERVAVLGAGDWVGGGGATAFGLLLLWLCGGIVRELLDDPKARLVAKGRETTS